MSQISSFSKKSFTAILLLMLLFFAAVDSIVYYGFYAIFSEGVIAKELFVKRFIPLSFTVCLSCTILMWMFVKAIAEKEFAGKPATSDKKETSVDQAKLEENRNKRFFLHLLSVLQRDARLLDFFFEKLDQFEDAQIGAAVRSIHENSYKTMTKYISPKPIIDNAEGEEVTIEKGFDPASVKLTGNVTGEPPFRGILRHKGWQAESFDLPKLSDRENTLLIAPAEVEL